MTEPLECRECRRAFEWGEDADSALVADASCKTNAYWKLVHHTLFAHKDVLMRCPRRSEGLPGTSDSKKDFWRSDFQGCSYCGSLSPEAFFAQIEAGARIGPTDKSYKVYVGHRYKFYFQHLSREEQDKFVTLYNEGKMTLGDPGYFYVHPFFCEPVLEKALAT